METAKINIGSEEDAWRVLEQAISGELKSEHIRLEFQEWPKLAIKLEGEKYHSSITPKLMEAILELQKDIHRSYALLHYGKGDIRALSEEEKGRLEVVVYVHEGSSDFEASLAKIIDQIGSSVADKMEPIHVVTIVLSTALLYFGSSVVRYWLDKRLEERQIDAQRFSSEQETQRMQILATAAGNHPVLDAIKQDAEEYHNTVMKGVSDADNIVYLNQAVPKDIPRQVITRPRQASKEIRLDGLFRILNVDTTDIEGTKVKLQHEDGRMLIALIQEGDITMTERDILKDAQWDRSFVQLNINARELRGEIVNATIVSVQQVAA